MLKTVIDLVDHRYGRYTVIRRAESKGGHTRWLCRCDCGTEKVVAGHSLRCGDSKSCGCLQREIAMAKGYAMVTQRSGLYKLQPGHCAWCHADYTGRVYQRFCTPDCQSIADNVARSQRNNADLADLELELNRRLHDVR